MTIQELRDSNTMERNKRVRIFVENEEGKEVDKFEFDGMLSHYFTPKSLRESEIIEDIDGDERILRVRAVNGYLKLDLLQTDKPAFIENLLFNEYGITGETVESNAYMTTVYISGDWKHDHRLADNLVQDYIKVVRISEREIEIPGCDETDYYDAHHTYYFSV